MKWILESGFCVHFLDLISFFVGLTENLTRFLVKAVYLVLSLPFALNLVCMLFILLM